MNHVRINAKVKKKKLLINRNNEKFIYSNAKG